MMLGYCEGVYGGFQLNDEATEGGDCGEDYEEAHCYLGEYGGVGVCPGLVWEGEEGVGVVDLESS